MQLKMAAKKAVKKRLKGQNDMDKWLGLTATDYGTVELEYIREAIVSQKLEGNGLFTKKVHQFFMDRYGFKSVFFTPSGTDALELAALLLPLNPGDEVIVPSYTFPSTAHAFKLRGLKIVLADSEKNHPNMDFQSVVKSVTSKTKVICVVHYGGASPDMEELSLFCKKNGIYLIEDAAQAIDSYYNSKPLGLFGDMSAFSFHQTKNISSGEGGLLVVNNPEFIKRAEIIREKGTNRQAFLRGEVDKYTCVDIGSSFVGSDLNAALLLGQLQRLDQIQAQRLERWKAYEQAFSGLKILKPQINNKVKHNAHNYYFVFDNINQRDHFINYMRSNNIGAVFHYVGLHRGSYYRAEATWVGDLKQSDYFTDGLVRLPLYGSLTAEEQEYIISNVLEYFKTYENN